MSELSADKPDLAPVPEGTSAEAAPKRRGRRGFTNGDLHPYAAKSTLEEIDRREVREAAYNPRTIDLNAKIKLKNGMEEFGLVEPLVWNKRTGNLVGGHQRIKIMDERVGHQDYKLRVSVVDLDETEEFELNVLLNNGGAQGWWDFPKLAEKMAATADFNAELAGFDLVDLSRILKQTVPDYENLDLTHVFGDLSRDEAKDDAEQIKAMKANKGEYKAAGGAISDDRVTLTLVFQTYEQKAKFCETVGVSVNAKFTDAVEFSHRLDIDIGHERVEDPELPELGNGDSVGGEQDGSGE